MFTFWSTIFSLLFFSALFKLMKISVNLSTYYNICYYGYIVSRNTYKLNSQRSYYLYYVQSKFLFETYSKEQTHVQCHFNKLDTKRNMF